MKKYFLASTFLLLACSTFSQSTFGILSYAVPGGWYAKESNGNTELVKKETDLSTCKIVFFKPVKAVMDSEAGYTRYRNELVNIAGIKTKSSTPVQKQTGTGWVTFSGLQGTNENSVAFYSISNSGQTVFLAVYSGAEGWCTEELDRILSSIDLNESNSRQEGGTKALAKPAGKKIRIAALKSLKALVN